MMVDDGVSMMNLMPNWWLCHGKELWLTRANYGEFWVDEGELLVQYSN